MHVYSFPRKRVDDLIHIMLEQFTTNDKIIKFKNSNKLGRGKRSVLSLSAWIPGSIPCRVKHETIKCVLLLRHLAYKIAMPDWHNNYLKYKYLTNCYTLLVSSSY